ncbi:MAG: SUMF1/EgtB/PvdO family nonheme iron enzyme [bacterium]|nr:SUMF1/EgtB/PvdO family nonheme iron enzyme [bacterium]
MSGATTYYSISPQNDPQGPENGSYRVLHGGSWYVSGTDARCAYRHGDYPAYLDGNFGFRCARTP